MLTVRALLVGTWQSGVVSNVLNHTGSFTDVGNQLVSVHLRVFCKLGIATVTTRVKKTLFTLVFLWIEHIIAFRAESERGHCCGESNAFCSSKYVNKVYQVPVEV